MTNLDIARQRLHNQRLIGTTFRRPEQVVGWLGAVQAQDFAGAKWALAQRAVGVTEAAVDQAFAEGAILRTHLLRPTWHFVTSADIRWLLALTAPRVHALNALYYRRFELYPATLRRAHAALAKALQGGQNLTRAELAVALERAGIRVAGPRLGYTMMHAELEALICSGPRRGKQFTYALLDDRAPNARTLEPEEALAELTRRYFSGRGPATAQDFAKWSVLTVGEAKAGLDLVQPPFAQEVADGRTYAFPRSQPSAKEAQPSAHFLPDYDEYFSSYQDHRASIEPEHAAMIGRGDGLFSSVIIVSGRAVGTWKRTLKKTAVAIQTRFFRPISKADQRLMEAAAQRYAAFLGLPAQLL